MELLAQTTKDLFEQMEDALHLICKEQYCTANTLMGNASIGQHVRHIIELFQEMLKGYSSGEINYEKRQRDFLTETDPAFAVSQMKAITLVIERPDRQLLLTTGYDMNNGATFTIASSYIREIIYNIEHTIHHMALIRIAFKSLFGIELNSSFGVAPSTLKYRRSCAQ